MSLNLMNSSSHLMSCINVKFIKKKRGGGVISICAIHLRWIFFELNRTGPKSSRFNKNSKSIISHLDVLLNIKYSQPWLLTYNFQNLNTNIKKKETQRNEQIQYLSIVYPKDGNTTVVRTRLNLRVLAFQ